jgi:hypothetical protein
VRGPWVKGESHEVMGDRGLGLMDLLCKGLGGKWDSVSVSWSIPKVEALGGCHVQADHV